MRILTNLAKNIIKVFRRKENGGGHGVGQRLLAPPNRDDVISAYRLILGREPENEKTIADHMQVPSVSELRQTLLESEEFRGKFTAMHPSAAHHPNANVDRTAIVFIHLQKTGGTSLREMIAKHFPEDRRCPVLEDKLHTLPLGQLGHYDFFAGHFDFSAIRFIPRNNIRCVALFREPRARLVSFYRFLRSHPTTDEFAGDLLKELAHALSAEDFFARPEIRSFPYLNNHYLNALGRSFWSFYHEKSLITDQVMATALINAKLQISAISALGITERFDESVMLIYRALKLTPPATIDALHVTDKFADVDSRFRRVAPVTMTPQLTESMQDLVAYDQILYDHALSEFDRRLAAERNAAPAALDVPVSGENIHHS